MKKLTLIFLLLGIIAIGFWKIVHHPYFRIAKIDIHAADGRELKRASQVDIFEAVKTPLAGSFFLIDLLAAQQAALEQPWVKQVKIDRVAPATVNIGITEYEPVAYWIKDGLKIGLVSSDGTIFQADFDGDLPELDGYEGTEEQMLQQYYLFEGKLKPLLLNIKRLKYTPRATWSFVLDNGVEVRLGGRDIEGRINRFVQLWRKELASQADNIDYVDMRYPDGAAVKRYENALSSTARIINEQFKEKINGSE